MPSSIYLKLISLVVLLAVAFGAAWNWRGARAESEKENAVKAAVVTAVEDIRTDMTAEREARIAHQQLLLDTLTALQGDVRRVQRIRARTAQDIAKDRADNSVFYSQPLPDLGRQAWINARASAVAASASASSPSPSPAVKP